MSDESRLLALIAVPDKSLLFCGADPCWSPEREGYRRDQDGRLKQKCKSPSVENCDLCGGAVRATKGTIVFMRLSPAWWQVTAVRLQANLEVRSCTLADHGHFFLPDGRVVRAARVDDPLMDSELVVHSCALCTRVSPRYAGRLKGQKDDTWKRRDRLSHRAERMVATKRDIRERKVAEEEEARRKAKDEADHLDKLERDKARLAAQAAAPQVSPKRGRKPSRDVAGRTV